MTTRLVEPLFPDSEEGNPDGMSTHEPFMPLERASGDEIDAADPGRGAPGTDSVPPTTAEDARAVESELGEQQR
ncbi:hypothetical protein ACWPOB_20360 [Rhodococcus sp. 2H158]